MNASEIIKSRLHDNRPNISKGSVNTYTSLLKSLYLSDNPNLDDFSLKWFDDESAIIKALAEKPAQTRKTAISALIVLFGEKKIGGRLNEMMNKDADEVREKYQAQKMSEKQEENWIPIEEVQEAERKNFEIVKPWLSQKTKATPEQLKMITDWMLLALTTGVYFPPRRSEWIHVKLSNFDKEKDNYVDLKKGVFVLNNYKTAKLYGREEIPYGKPFGALLKKYIAVLPDDQEYLLQNNGKPFTAPLITLRLNKLFGKKVSTSMLRHIWVSSKYADMPSLKELAETADAMGHSIQQNLQYIVKK